MELMVGKTAIILFSIIYFILPGISNLFIDNNQMNRRNLSFINYLNRRKLTIKQFDNSSITEIDKKKKEITLKRILLYYTFLGFNLILFAIFIQDIGNMNQMIRSIITFYLFTIIVIWLIIEKKIYMNH